MNAPTTLLADGETLTAQRVSVDADDPALVALRAAADEAMSAGPFSVVRDGKLSVPGAAPNDFVSIGIYWWPDPEAPDGLPYIRRDGEVNPETAAFDRKPLAAMQRAAEALSWGWFFTDDARYAERAAVLLRAWFLDPATAMAPHLRFAQGIPGRCFGRGIGIIDTHDLIWLLDAVEVLRGSGAWTDADHTALRAWFGDLVDWMLASANGQDERATENNHATWYDAQVVAFARFAGRDVIAREVLDQVAVRRLFTQVEADGTQPRELARTLSMNYSQMNLLAFAILARLGEALGVDLWQARGEDGRGIEAAARFLLPYRLGEAEWPHRQIKPAGIGDMALQGWGWLDRAYGLDALPRLLAQVDPERQRRVRLLT